MLRRWSHKCIRDSLSVMARRGFTTSTGLKGPALPSFSYTPKPYQGISLDEAMALRKEYLSPALLTYYKKPIMIVEGKGQYLFDEKGRRYVDAFAGIVTVSVGHCHPYVTEVAKKQMEALQHTTTIYLHPAIGEFAKALAEKLPPPLKVAYFVNSGSEANDLAMLMARLHTKNLDIIALRNGYHGMSPSTMGLTALHTWKYPVPHGEHVKHTVNPDPYRGFYAGEPDAGVKYARHLKDLILHGTCGQVAGFIAETIQGVGGAVPLADGFLAEAYKIVRSHGGVCIADEVQTGFGRTGSHYWGFQMQGVVPDIVTMAKGIGNGTPLAAVVTTPEIAKSLTQRIHFNTYGGNPVAMAIGKAVIEVIDREGLQKNSAEIGAHLKAGLKRLAERHSLIGDVRGAGLMLGVEFVKDRKTKEPATAETAEVFERAKDMGLLVGKGGLFGNVLRIKPPMCFTKKDADFLVDVLDVALKSL